MSSPIDVKTAVRNAIAYLQQFQEFITARAVRLEETEYDDKGYWLITLSSIDDPDVSDTLYKLTGSSRDHKREYKIFRIDAETGQVKSMKVRSLQPVD